MPDLSRVTETAWAARFEDAKTDHEAMGIAWSYLLANLAAGPSTPTRRNELRRRVTQLLIDEATGIWKHPDQP